MANEFIARKGLRALENSQITGSLNVSGNITANNLSGTNTGDQDLSSLATITQLNASSSELQTNIDASVQPSQTGSFLTAADTGSLITTTQTSSFLIAADTGSLTTTAELNASSSALQTNIDSKATIAQLNASSSALQTNINASIQPSQTGSFLTATDTGSFITAAQTSSFSTATGVEDNADVTDTSNVTAAGALMDSELAEIATVKTLTAAGISGSFTAASSSFGTRISANEVVTAKTLISGSSQVSFNSISGLPSGLLSSSNDFVINSATSSFIVASQTGSFLTAADTGSLTTTAELNASSSALQTNIDAKVLNSSTASFAITGSSVLFGNITASGDISSSGTIIGNEITSSKLLITKTGASSNETLISLIGSAGVEEFSVDEDGDLTCNDINVVNRDIKGNGTTRLTLGSTNLFVGDVRVNNTTANLNLRCSDNSIAAGQTMGKISLATSDGDTTDAADIKFIATEDHSNDPNSGTKIEFRADKNSNEGDETDTLMLTLNPNTGSIIESVHQNIYDTGSTALAANSAFGDIVKFGDSTTVAGGIYYLKPDGTWGLAQANAAGTATGSLAVAVGTNSTTDGMCLRGFVNPFTDPGAGVGNPVYVSDTAQGRFISTAPDSNNDVVRIVGYQYGTDLIYFNPSNDFIIVTA